MNQQQFETIYHLLYGTAGFLSLMFASIQDVKRRYFYKAGTFLSFVLVFLFAILFGSRGNEVGTDTEMYIWQYENYQLFPINIDFIYSYLLIFLNWLDIGTHGFLLVISCFYLFILGWAISVFSKKIRLNLLFIFFAFISFFFFKSLGINIIRQGVALSFFLLGVSYFFKLDKINGQAVLAFILAVGFHYTILVAALLFVFAIISKKIRIEYFITFYVTCLILALLNFGIKDFASVFSFLLIDERRNTYLEDYGSDNYEIGFKPQFVAFNSIFLIIFYWIRRRYKQIQLLNVSNYEILLKYYILMSGLFFLTFQIAYSDRWGVMSWFVIPFLFSPIFSMKSNALSATLGVFMLICVYVIFSFL